METLPTKPQPTILQIALAGALALGLSATGAWHLRNMSHDAVTSLADAGHVAMPNSRIEAARLSRGHLVYQVYCTRCHGPEGRGDGPSAAELKPPPRDFRSGALKFGSSPAAVRKVIVEGVPGTPMPSGQAIASDDVDALVTFVTTLVSHTDVTTGPSAWTRNLIDEAGYIPVDSPFGAPDLHLLDTNGNSVSLARLRGQWVLLDFWGTSCGFCLADLPAIEQLAGELHDRGLEVLCLCADEQDAATVAAVARQRVEKLPVYTDPKGTACLRFDVRLIPTSYLIDPSGRVVGKSQGAREWSVAGFEALLSAYAAGTLQ